MKKIMTVVGARPQFIKAAAFSRAIAGDAKLSSRLDEELVHTGQHFDANMSDVFFEDLAIPTPTLALGVGGGSHGQATGRMLEKLDQAIQERTPDLLLVYGDTNSTIAGALAAAKLHVPVAHVEAGLRSYNRKMPEEINRVMTDHVSSILFCPTEHSANTLAKEGITDGVHVVGDFMYDVFQLVSEKVEARRSEKPYALMTLHRAETTDHPDVLKQYLDGVAKAGIDVVFPIHPRTRKALKAYGLSLPDNVIAEDPLGYSDMVAALKGCDFVMTDSGGLQKEAYFAGKACMTFRTESEWVELFDAGVNRLVPPSQPEIAEAVEWAKAATLPTSPLYGEGDSALKTARLISDWLAEA